MAGYLSGKGYRADLRSRPRQSSTPAAREGTGPYAYLGHLAPVTRHNSPPTDHKETVGWMDGKYIDRTTPNADSRTGTDRLYADRARAKHQQFGPASKDSEPQRRGKTSLKG